MEDAPRLQSSVDGGYPVYYVLRQRTYGGREETLLCPACATDAYRDAWESDKPSAYMVVDVDVNWEDPDLYCDCGERIPSAYADDEEDETP